MPAYSRKAGEMKWESSGEVGNKNGFQERVWKEGEGKRWEALPRKNREAGIRRAENGCVRSSWAW